jgi:hypothetical protein
VIEVQHALAPLVRVMATSLRAAAAAEAESSGLRMAAAAGKGGGGGVKAPSGAPSAGVPGGGDDRVYSSVKGAGGGVYNLGADDAALAAAAAEWRGATT